MNHLLKHLRRNHQWRDVQEIEISYSLMVFEKIRIMNVDGSKIIFGLGVASAVALAVFALYFSIR